MKYIATIEIDAADSRTQPIDPEWIRLQLTGKQSVHQTRTVIFGKIEVEPGDTQ